SPTAVPTVPSTPTPQAAITPTAAPGLIYDKPVIISFSTWTGYGIIWVALDKGFFRENGIEVEVRPIQSPGERFNALAAGALDGLSSTLDTFVRVGAQGIPVVGVVMIDESRGGDGIVAKKEIQSVADLKGKTVAVNKGSTSFWFLANVLAEQGLTVDDLNISDMTAADAGAAFVAGKVDAAVTWEPWLSRAAQTDFGHILVTTKDYPGLIVDVFGFRRDFAQQHPEVVVAFIKGLVKAHDYLEKNREDSIQIMATRFKQEPEVIRANLETLRYFSIAESKEFFGTRQKPGRIYEVADQMAEFWMKLGVIKEKPDLQALLDPQYLEQVP
ncbi:MAG: ABC transporter substrate-binding protein, partial [Thermomicrobium sp.]